MALTIIPSPLFLSKVSVGLGRFVTNLEQPHEGYHTPLPNETPKQDSRPYKFSSQQEAGRDSSFGTALTSLLTAGFSKRAKTKVRVAATIATEYVLDNSEEWFDRAVSTEDTKRWIERAATRGKKMYMIVGMQTVTDARILQNKTEGRDVGGQISAPVSLTLATAGAVVPFADLIDPSVHGEHHSHDNGVIQFIIPGEQVCALQYREVRHKWLSSKTADQSSLSATRRWSCTEGAKRTFYEEEENDEDLEDMIEVVLGSIEAPGDGWMSETGTGRSIYMRA